ncbi:Cytochrome P450 monooxygenase 1 [Apiospora phragmitis]|uniref:Cytochrome P450 monooxygenase 1 n=1 Tax=Apiospora phragmitis TaxID=2905665 RepID=A0ABR1UVD2_9PEZI
MTQWFQWLTFDMVVDVCWGESFDCVSKQESHPCLALSMDMVSLSCFVVFVAWWKGLKDLLVRLSGVEGLFVRLVRSKCERNVASSASSKKSSIYSNLHAAGDPLGPVEVDGNLTAIVIAGSETTGFALTATSYYLAKNPDCFRTAAAEINDDAVRKLPYLKATIDEALRMTPAEPNGLARQVVVDGLDIAGHHIPKKYTDRAYHTDCDLRLPVCCQSLFVPFSSSKRVSPQRWLGDPEFKDDELDAVQPFLMGVNVCIGRGLAWMEMRLTLARLLWEFDWTINEADGEAFERSKAWHVWMKSPVHLQVSKRDPRSLGA